MINVAICQCASVGSPEENLNSMASMALEAVKSHKDLDLVVFPEYAYYSPLDIEESKKVAIDLNKDHPFITKMKEIAKEYKVNIIPGSFAEKAEDDRVRNTSIFINREGQIIGKYSKIHLMDAASYKESSYVSPGDKMCLVDADFGRIGLMVCYDLRFPELARSMCLQGAKFIVVPSMFPSGQPLPPRVDDWDLLIRSTALTNLTYVVAANQFGSVHKDNPFGRSAIVDPRGTIVSGASGRVGIIYGSIDLDYQKQVQENLAVWINRRPDVYRL